MWPPNLTATHAMITLDLLISETGKDASESRDDLTSGLFHQICLTGTFGLDMGTMGTRGLQGSQFLGRSRWRGGELVSEKRTNSDI